MKSLNDKVAIVVGASSGMGRACALAFAQEGAQVCALARREQELVDLENKARGAGGDIFSRALDARDRPAVMAAVEETVNRYGRVDVLLYATGINVKKRDVAVIEPADWNAIIDTNLNGAYNFVQAVLPAMRRQQDGQIIMISSVSGRWTDFSGSAYQASKHGLNGLTHAITLEERKNGIRATTILPGLCHTPIVDSRPIPLPDEIKAQMMKTEDIAAACVFAASLPARTYVAEMVLYPTALQGMGETIVK